MVQPRGWSWPAIARSARAIRATRRPRPASSQAPEYTVVALMRMRPASTRSPICSSSAIRSRIVRYRPGRSSAGVAGATAWSALAGSGLVGSRVSIAPTVRSTKPRRYRRLVRSRPADGPADRRPFGGFGCGPSIPRVSARANREPLESADPRHPNGAHLVDDGSGRPGTEDVIEPIDRLRGSLSDRPDRTIGLIGDPAGEPERSSLAEDEIAESNALNAAANPGLQARHAVLHSGRLG